MLSWCLSQQVVSYVDYLSRVQANAHHFGIENLQESHGKICFQLLGNRATKVSHNKIFCPLNNDKNSATQRASIPALLCLPLALNDKVLPLTAASEGKRDGAIFSQVNVTMLLGVFM